MPESKEINIKNTSILTYFIGFISFVIFVYILIALREILIPITIAIFMTYLLHPALEYLHDRKVPRWVTISLLLIAMFGLYYLLGLLLASNYPLFADKIKYYVERLLAFLESSLAPFNLTIKELSEMLNLRIDKFDASSIFQGLFKAGIIQSIFNSLSALLSNLFISLIFWIFMILGKKNFEERIKVAFASKSDTISKILISINTQLQSYLVIKTIVSIITALIVSIILWAYGIDFPLAWGILTFLFNFIPNIGSILISIFPILVALIEYGFGFTSISMAVLLFFNQSIMGNFIEPHFMGRQMDLSTVFVLFSLIFWGWIWGIVGMFLSVPIAAAMKIICSNFEPLKPLAVLMGSNARPVS
ncbi:MAG TPA: AI-2E family transporter [Ignavibacteriaceae bacterium]|nr:AI-2E family transporter [Ignavibacteriaceae bacterium]